MIFNSNGNLFDSFNYEYWKRSDDFCSNFYIFWGIPSQEEGMWLYHQGQQTHIRIPNLPKGNYTSKVVFTLKNMTESVETNTISFTKE